MKTPEEKYRNDSEYHLLVDTMVRMIDRGQFTPSEMREAATFASTIYELMHVRLNPIAWTPEQIRDFANRLREDINYDPSR